MRMPDLFARNRYYSGNALIEYGLIGAVVTVLAIAVLLGMGGDLAGWLNGLRDDMRQNIATAGPASGNGTSGNPSGNNANATNTNGNPSPNTNPVPINSGNALPPAGPSGPITINGQSITPPPTPYVPPITSGGNGSEFTLGFSESLRQLAEQIRQADPDSPLSKLISELANAGHEVGEAQSELETLCQPKQLCGQKDPQQQTIDFGMYEDTTQAFAQIGMKHGAFNSRWDSLQAYLTANPNPALESYIAAQVQGIDAIASQYTPVIKDANDPDYTGNNTGESVEWAGITTSGSAQTHQHANNTCQAGGTNCTR